RGRRRGGRPRPPDTGRRARCPARPRADRVALAEPAPRLPRARFRAAPLRRLPALPLAEARRPAGLRPRGARSGLDSRHVVARAHGRDPRRSARRLGGRAAARVGLERPPLLGLRPRHSAAPRRGDQPGAARLPGPLRRADRRRLAALRRPVRALLHAEPGDPAEHARAALAAPFDPALRARRLPLLPRARLPRRTASRPYGNRGGERDHARRRGRPVGAVAMGRLRAADLEAVTIDAYGTLVTLRDPVGALDHALREQGVERTRDGVARAFAEEARYYVERSHEGADEASLALLRRDCASVFLEAAEADLDPADFVPAFVAALEFEAVPGALEAVSELERLGLRLAV